MIKKYAKAATIGFFFIILLIGIRLTGLHKCITLEVLHANKDCLIHLVATYYWKMVFGYIAFYTIGVALSLPIALLSTVAGGFFFGFLPAVLYANIAATLGAMISFFFVRYSIGTLVQEKYASKLAHFNAMVEQHGAKYLLVIHLVAFVPFSMVNMLAGLTTVSWWTFLWTTVLGIIPTSLLYTYAGRRLSQITSIIDIFTLDIVLGMILIALFAGVLMLYFRKRMYNL